MRRVNIACFIKKHKNLNSLDNITAKNKNEYPESIKRIAVKFHEIYFVVLKEHENCVILISIGNSFEKNNEKQICLCKMIAYTSGCSWISGK